MRIYSNVRDYYDCVMAKDREPWPVYIRKLKVFPLKEKLPFVTYAASYNKSADFSLRQHTLGFCGRLYAVLEVFFAGEEWSRPGALCHNLPHLDAFLNAQLGKAALLRYNRGTRYKWTRRMKKHSFYTQDLSRESFMRFFDEFTKASNLHESWFVRDGISYPVFAITSDPGRHCLGAGNTAIMYNACLEPYEFFRVIDPYLAYQELVMYLNNIAVPMKPIPEWDDETKAHSKGFDRFSFRKDPTKRKK